MQRIPLMVRVLVMAVTLGGALVGMGGTAAAQELTVDLPIVAFNCPYDPGDVSLAAGNIPADCTELAGVSFTVRDNAGTVIATCTTGDSGSCVVALEAPEEPTPVIVVEDVTTVPAGFVPRANPVEAFIGVPEAAALFINIPTEEAQPDTTGLTVFKHNCPSAAAAAAFEAGDGSCELGGGVTFEVATANGEILGICTTEIGMWRTAELAFCSITGVPYDTPLVITEDVSTGPAGYVPLQNPQTMTVQRPGPEVQDFTPIAVFVNVPAEAGGGPTEVTVCNEANGKLVEVSEEAIEMGSLDFPYHLATEDEMAAGECADQAPGEPAEENETTTGAIALPNTGSGTIAAGDQSNHVLAVTLTLVSGMFWGLQRRLSR